MDSLEITSDKSRIDLDVIHDFLTCAYWAKGRSKETVRKSIEGSLCLGAYLNGEQVGFLRAVTDRVLFGYIFDVFVVEKWRGEGIARQMMTVLIENPEHRHVRWMLKTTNAGALYLKLGFTPVQSADNLFIKHPAP